MKGDRNNLEIVLVWSVPVLFLLIVGMILFLYTQVEPDTEKIKKYEKTEEAAVAETESEQMTDTETEEMDTVQRWMDNLTLEEKVAQLFVITPEQLTGVEAVQAAGPSTQSAFEQYPVGGLIYFEQNLESPDQLKNLLSNMQQIAQEQTEFPVFLSVDEEGGRVARIANQGSFGVENPGTMYSIGETGDSRNAYDAAASIADYLGDYGFNLDYAPIADVIDTPENQVIGDRSFGTDPHQVTDFVAGAVEGFHSRGIKTVLKHFPGHGMTEADSHDGYAYSLKTLEELEEEEFLPFQSGIAAGSDMVMAGHISLPNVTGNDTPATFSSMMVETILREQLGFDGVVITDALNMGAVTDHYTSEEAAVAALEAGCDMLLMPADFSAAYQGVLSAVNTGRISENRIDESVRRILKIKETIQ